MAGSLLNVVTEAVLSKALSLISERISSAWGVKEDLESLAEQLEMIQALLSDAESKSRTNRAVGLWLKKLEDAAADADSLLDDFTYQVLSKDIEERTLLNKVCNFFSPSGSFAFRFKMYPEIKKTNLRITRLFQESIQIGLVRQSDEIVNSSADIRRDRITDPFVDYLDIVGRNDDVENVVGKLTSSKNDKDLSVIGIWGMAGQGKTTLAQLVYNKKGLTGYFEKKIWVCVSDNFSEERILNDMLQSVTKRGYNLTKRDVIVEKLKKKLEGKTYLLVLDDVWNEDEERWTCLKKCLQEIGGSEGSKIIVTSRSERVVSIMRAFPIYLRALSEEDSWKLFEKRAFAEGEAVKNPELVNIGKRIVKRCGGLPLAIKALGSILYFKKDASQWSKIEGSDIWDSLDGPNRVLPIIKLSYDYLPSLSLKQCFAYCAVFQKDTIIIERNLLIQQWMAHGLLNPSRGSKLDMEDVGNNHFTILLQRSLFQDAKYDEFGNVESCKMHDVVHDFALQASKGRCLTVKGTLQNPKAVHLSIISNRIESVDGTVETLSKLRTLMFLARGMFSDDAFANCKNLCVLVVDLSISGLPKSIAKLKHLRYLDISATFIEKLPNSITKLYNLQTLRLKALQELPSGFGNLVKLRHLYISDGAKAFLAGIGELTSLRTLSCFAVRDWGYGVEDLQYLQNLEGTLKIFGLDKVSGDQTADLSSKRNIVNLELHWSADTEISSVLVLEALKPNSNLKGLKIVNYMGWHLPFWMLRTGHQVPLHNLVSIRLKNLELCEEIPVLRNLPFLKVVDIVGMNSLKCIGNEFYGWTNESDPVSFPSLKMFSLRGAPNLNKWSDPTVHPFQVFPLLDKLAIGYANLTRLPNLLGTISSLKKLTIIDLENLSHLLEGLDGLVSLEELRIEGCSALVSIPSIQGLQSLKILIISGCNTLVSLPRGLEACKKLEEMTIRNCSSIRLEDLCCPINLKKLELESSSEMASLPDQIQHLPADSALKELRVKNFHGMEALPEWLCIPSLVCLRVSNCSNLAYLPSREAMLRFKRSCALRFSNCPILKERCENKHNREWEKIANLTNIRF